MKNNKLFVWLAHKLPKNAWLACVYVDRYHEGINSDPKKKIPYEFARKRRLFRLFLVHQLLFNQLMTSSQSE